MNFYTEALFDYAFYTKLMSDTFLYILYDNETLVNNYKEQEHGLKAELDIDAPINTLLSQDNDEAKEIKNLLKDFYEFLFTTEKYLTLTDNKVTVKHTLDINAAEYVIDYLTKMLPIFNAHAIAYDNQGNLEDNARAITNFTRGYTVSLAMTTLFVLMEQRYFAFNKISIEKKSGYQTVAKELVAQLQKVFELYINFRNSISKDFGEFAPFFMSIDHMIKVFTGEEKVGSLSDAYNMSKDTRKLLVDNVNEVGKNFNSYYVPMLKKIYEAHKDNLSKAN